ncbi:MAG: GNAT family N-acetyltransferase [Methylocella sp.]
MNSAALQEIAFRSVGKWDFPLLIAWLAEPHVRRFYQKTSVSLEQVASEYGPCVRGEEPGICHLAISAGKPFAYLQCYRNADYREWADLIGVDGGISVDLFIGESTYLRKGFGRAALSGYLRRVAFPCYREEEHAYIAHDRRNIGALNCSLAVGFHPLRAFLEDGCEMLLLTADRNSIEICRPKYTV